MALTGKSNTVDILIQSEFVPSGFAKATAALKGFVKDVQNVNSQLAQVAKVGADSSKSVENVGKSATNASKSIDTISKSSYSLVREMGNVNRDMLALGRGIADFNNIATGSAKVMGEAMPVAAQKSASSFSTLTSTIGAGASKIGGYLTGVVKQSISVGDIFGFYIGTMALTAIYDLTIGVSMLRQEMETTFEYMGFAKETVKAFSTEVFNFAVEMPKLSIGGANEIVRSLTLSGASMDNILKYKQTWADLATIYGSINAVSPEVAASKIGPAISDAVGGNMKRLLNAAAITTTQFKETAAKMGLATEGSFENTMKVINQILSDRGLTGVAAKMTSLADVWAYVTEKIYAKGSLLGDSLLGPLTKLVTGFGIVLDAIPLPIFGIIIALVGLIASILVFLPLIASVVESFKTLDIIFEPISRRVFNLKAAWEGYGRTIKVTDDFLKDHIKNYKDFSDSQIEHMLKQKGYGVEYKNVPGGGQQMFVRPEEQSKGFQGLSDRIRTMADNMKRYNKENSIFSSMGKKNGSILSGLGSGFKNAAIGAGSLAKSIGMVAKESLIFMFTNPLGILLTLAGAFLLLMTYTNSWGKLMDLVNKILTECAKVIDPLIALMVDLGEKGWEAIKNWEGWEVIAGFIKEAYNNIKGFAEYVSTLNAKAEEGGGGVKGLGNSFNKTGKEAQTLTSNLIDGSGGTQSFADAASGLQFIMLMLSNPVTAVMYAMDALSRIMLGAKVALNEWYQTAEGGLALEELNLALEQLGDAWAELQTTIDTSAAQLKPILDQLGEAWSDLMEAIYGKKEEGGGIDPTGGKGGETAEKITLVKLAVDGLKWSIGALTTLIQIATPIIQFIGEIFKFVGWVISGVVQIITFGVKVWTDLTIQMKGLRAACGPLGDAFSGLMYPIMIVVYAIIELWHWITGNSPGLMPAFNDLLLLVGLVWPMIQGIIVGTINVVLGVIRSFIDSAVSWFSGLPSQIGGALSSLQGYVVQEFWDAYHGAQNMIHQFFELGKQIKDQVVAGIKSALGISSPSKVTYGLGEFVAQGLIEGMKDWVKNNVSYFSKNLAKDIGGVLTLLSNMFAGFNYQFYYDSMYSVGTVLQTMTGNCWDAAQAFIALADKMGLTAQLYRTFVGSIPHMVVNLPQVGMWIDPSGILGTGLRSGNAPGAPAGAPILVNINDPIVKDEEDLNGVAKITGKRILDVVRFGI